MKLARVGNKNSHGRACYADGGRVEEDISDPGSLPSVTSGMKTDGVAGIDGGKAKPRLDRARKPASTTVNIVVASNKPDQPPAPPVPPMPAMGGTPMPPPPMPAPGVPMRASGGRVCKADGGKVLEDGEGPGGISGYLSRRGERAAKGAIRDGLVGAAAIGAGNVLAPVTGGASLPVGYGIGGMNIGRGMSKLGDATLKHMSAYKLGKMKERPDDEEKESRSGKKSGGRVNHSDAPEDKKMISKMVHKHEANMHKGKPETKFMKGGVVRGAVGTQSGPRQVSSTKPMTSKQARELADDHPPVNIKNRATGGRVNVDAGAGGGLGRLEKAKDYGLKGAKGKK